ncbi:MAG: peroxiredoxin [Sandaracinaceae bacterium]|nr:peroxiredoxin [Sandaracinaceae bacterium]
MLEPGHRAPDFVRLDHRGQVIDTALLRQKGPLVVFFYPKDFTPGCTREACLFRDAYEEFCSESVSVIGISSDSDESHARFAQRYQLPFALISDQKHELARAFGVRRPFGIFGNRRVTFVIDQEGTVRAAIHAELSMEAHLQGVRRAIGELLKKPAATQ